jgi:hypothetical protein
MEVCAESLAQKGKLKNQELRPNDSLSGVQTHRGSRGTILTGMVQSL